MKIHAALLALALLLAGPLARAGTVTIDRNDGSLVDAQTLQAEAARWPFALHVLVGDYGTKANLMRAAHVIVHDRASSSPSYDDAGGGGSSFDDDAGGGGSDFGGGFDSGGGGFDGGGGGGDF